jgi:hypothetical protein
MSLLKQGLPQCSAYIGMQGDINISFSEKDKAEVEAFLCELKHND